MMFFFFNDTATTEIYTLSLHDALPISFCGAATPWSDWCATACGVGGSKSWVQRSRWERWSSPRPMSRSWPRDRKSTRLNSSHLGISYAVFCLKKKNTHGAIDVILLFGV